MKRIALFFALLVANNFSFAQLLTWSPQFPTETSTITITVDATKGNQGLMGVTSGVYMHLGVLTNLSTGASPWKYVPASCVWGTTTAPAATAAGTNKWSFTITNPRTFFNVPAGETIQKIALLFRDGAGAKKQANTDGTDMYIPLYSTANNIRITTPTSQPTFARTLDPIVPTPTAGLTVPVTAVSSVSGALTLALNGVQFSAVTGTTISGNATAVMGNNEIIASLNGSAFDTISFYITPVTQVAAIPSTAKEGINYYANCADSVTLVLYAPGKSSCMLIGDFPGSNWTSQTQYLMKKSPDGNYFWITVHGLTSGTEYAYQYIVDNSIYIADPYCEKILDPWNDTHINPNSYPNIKAYPTNPNVSSGKNGYVSVLQVCEPQYNWSVTNFSKPDSKQLMIYELLVRDFTKLSPPASGYDSIGNYQSIIDSINYFKRLGINAIELMPVQEFSGNQSWGYNPTFYFAPDKVYGSKNKLKELIDTLHKNGIAVILDVVFNQEDASMTPHGKLYWDAVNNRPATNNPWLNPVAPHMYSVFNDFNHSTTATQNFVKRNLEFWCSEYKVDGFRFDLVKGFTQNSGTESTYDASRVGYMDTYKNYVNGKGYTPYFILEFLGALSEEQDYVNKGMFPWRNMNGFYNECTMGQTGSKNIGNVMWNYNNQVSGPGLVGYMESHDEERLMYKNLQYGGSSGSYNVKDLNTALARMEAAGAVFFTIPGPKMIWQFGEMGYDYSLTYGGSNVSNKPPRWDFLTNANRKKLYDAWSRIIKLRLDNPNVFTNVPTAYDLSNSNNGYLKYFQIGESNISNTQVTVVANFALTAQSVTINFQKTGNWTNYISNGTSTGLNGATGVAFTLSAASQTIVLNPGEYHIYVSVPNCTPPAAPSISTTTATTFCSGGNVILTSSASSGNQWYVNGNIINGETGVTYTAGTSGNYTVTTTVSGCTSAQSSAKTVTVNPIPATPSISTTTATTFCSGGSVVLTSSASSGNQWYVNGNIINGETGATYTAATAAGYTVKVTTNGCVSASSAATVVVVNSIPSISGAVATNTTACATNTGSIKLSGLIANTAYSISYTKTTVSTITLTSDASGNITIPNLGAGSYSNITATLNSCTSLPVTASISDPGSPAAPVINTTTATTFCSGGNVVLTSSAATGNQWYVNGNIINGETGVTYTAGTSGNYTVTTTVGGCVSAASAAKTVTVNSIPATPTISTTTSTTFCSGGNVILTSSASSGNQWYVNGNIITGETGATYTAGTTAGYTVKVTTNGCTSASSAATGVTVNAIPSISGVTTTNTTACGSNTGSVKLSGLIANTVYSISYTKTTISTVSLTSDASGNITIPNLGAGSYTNITASLNGCTSSPKTASVSDPGSPAAPTISTTTTTTFCSGGSVVLTSSASTGNQWYVNGNIISGETGATYSAGTSGSYTVTTTVGGCVSAASIAKVVTVNANPSIPTVSVTQPTCTVATATITVTSDKTGLIFSNNGVDYTNTTGIFAGVAASAAYSITAKNSNGCFSPARTGTTEAQPTTPAQPQVSAVHPTCTVSTGTVTVTSDKTGLTFSNNGIDYTNTTGIFANIAALSGYSITAKNTSGCVSPAATGSINAQPPVPAQPTVSVTSPTCSVATATISVTSTLGGLSFSSDGTNYTNTNGVFTNVAASSSYSITAKNSNGCISTAATGSIIAQPAVPLAPAVVSPVNYCRNEQSAALTATGSSLLWYTSLTGASTAIAPVPSTSSAGSATYYVTQSNACGESPKAAITVNVNSLTAPAGLVSGDITNSTAALSWSPVSGAVSYTVEFKPSDGNVWTTASANVTGTSYTLSGLSRATAYNWRVSSNCSLTTTGDYSATAEFTTASYIVTNVKNGLGIMVVYSAAYIPEKIVYIVPNDGKCSIVLYNSVGQKTKLIIEKQVTAGLQEPIALSEILSPLAKGMYHLQIRQGGLTNFTKFIKP